MTDYKPLILAAMQIANAGHPSKQPLLEPSQIGENSRPVEARYAAEYAHAGVMDEIGVSSKRLSSIAAPLFKGAKITNDDRDKAGRLEQNLDQLARLEGVVATAQKTADKMPDPSEEKLGQPLTPRERQVIGCVNEINGIKKPDAASGTLQLTDGKGGLNSNLRSCSALIKPPAL
jgi:hypothetical protein